MQRIYNKIIKEHIADNDQMLFIAGPRQVGKTTCSMAAQSLTDRFYYFNWDVLEHRNILVAGPTIIAEHISIATISDYLPIVVFDEIHKYSKWKHLLKGFYDLYKDKIRIIVTGSSRLDVFRKGGESLMGRYFIYRMHPISVAECLSLELSAQEICQPRSIDNEVFNALLEFGGFPQPFLKRELRFVKRWQRLRHQQLFREDIRDLSRIQEIGQLEILAELLQQQSGQLVNYSNLANKVRVSVDTIRRWIAVLESFYYCFTIRPWKKNVTRSLLKEPKVYLWDWSLLQDSGQKAENFIACHLLKAVHFWTDQGLGDYQLHFVRDLQKNEVDFVVTKDQEPWFLVEVKNTHNHSLSSALIRFQRQLNVQHAFQVAMQTDFVNKDCFAYSEPVIVPAKTLLSQLV